MGSNREGTETGYTSQWQWSVILDSFSVSWKDRELKVWMTWSCFTSCGWNWLKRCMTILVLHGFYEWTRKANHPGNEMILTEKIQKEDDDGKDWLQCRSLLLILGIFMFCWHEPSLVTNEWNQDNHRHSSLPLYEWNNNKNNKIRNNLNQDWQFSSSWYSLNWVFFSFQQSLRHDLRRDSSSSWLIVSSQSIEHQEHHQMYHEDHVIEWGLQLLYYFFFICFCFPDFSSFIFLFCSQSFFSRRIIIVVVIMTWERKERRTTLSSSVIWLESRRRRSPSPSSSYLLTSSSLTSSSSHFKKQEKWRRTKEENSSLESRERNPGTFFF